MQMYMHRLRRRGATARRRVGGRDRVEHLECRTTGAAAALAVEDGARRTEQRLSARQRRRRAGGGRVSGGVFDLNSLQQRFGRR